jgi:hypothetical protein
VFCALLRLLSLTQPFVFKGWGKEHCTGWCGVKMHSFGYWQAYDYIRRWCHPSSSWWRQQPFHCCSKLNNIILNV